MKSVKKGGMDYWKDLDVTTYVNWDDFCEKNPNAKIYIDIKPQKEDMCIGSCPMRTGLLHQHV